jgi:hypothetical protein
MNEGQMAFSQVMAHGSRFVLDRCIRRYGCVFRGKWATDSDRSGPLIPTQAGHPFRGCGPAIPAEVGHPG